MKLNRSTSMSSLWAKWTINCALGELIGIGCAGLLAYSANTLLGEPDSLVEKLIILLIMLIAGLIEGTVLSFFQWRILVRKIPTLNRSIWFKYTASVAVLGWFLGMLPPLFLNHSSEVTNESQEPSRLVILMLSTLLGLFLGALFGLFQWFVLKKHISKAYKWIIANALGWSLAMSVIFFFASIPDEQDSLIFIITMGTIAGLLAGLIVGMVTGISFIGFKLLKKHIS